MKSTILILAGLLISYGLSAQEQDFKTTIEDWPEASKMAAEEMMKKYGEPDVMGEGMMVWMEKGDWHQIAVSKEETEHVFPVKHTDMMKQSVMYDVPNDKVDELVEFDGSVSFERTQGLLSARCDKEMNNILALNLAHDVITGEKSVAEAREAYGQIAKEKMNGGDPDYMKKLNFKPQRNAPDPGENTTGLNKKGQPVKK